MARCATSVACKRPSSSCTLETRDGALVADGSSVVGGDKRDFAMTETASHRVTLGTCVATCDRGLDKGLGNESALTVTVSHPSCDGAPTPIGASRSRHIDAMLASERVVRAQSADFVRRLALGESTVEDAAESGLARRDLAKVLASSMTWYIEFPHVDGLFLELAKTLPGYGTAR